MQRKLRVFLCHSSQDKVAVRNLYKNLLSEDWIEPWLDEEKLIGGQDFNLEIQKATNEADVIIICLSKKSVLKEGYVNREIRRALDVSQEKREGEIFIIPLRLDDCDPSFAQLRKLQWVDYFKLDAHEKLILALKIRAESLLVQSREISRLKHNSINRYIWGSVIAVVIFICIVASVISIYGLDSNLPLNSILGKLISKEPTATQIPSSTPSLTPTSTFTPIPPTVTPTLGVGSTINGIDGMILVYVPGGEFTMGNDSGEEDEKPEHLVYLDSYWIDRTEVTNLQYAKCVNDGACDSPLKLSSNTREIYYGNPEFDNYPVIFVQWNMAKDYCEWVHRDLPSEAQWEKAARGIDGRKYPWGNTKLHASYLNYQGSNIGDTTEVGAYPKNVSPYGAVDMAGNVYEWVNDWYDPVYYHHSLSFDPVGPNIGTFKIVRGGAFSHKEEYATTTYRNRFPPDTTYNFGFRCVLNVIP